MRVLFDNGTPRGVARALSGHAVEEARTHGWDALTNGELLAAAEAAGFDVLVTTDRNLRYQQNLCGRKLAIVVLTKARWRLIRLKLEAIQVAVSAANPGDLVEVKSELTSAASAPERGRRVPR